MKFSKICSCLCGIFSCCMGLLTAPSVQAHPISFSEVMVNVSEDKVAVQIRVMSEDLFLFQNLEPDDQNRFQPDALSAAIEKHKYFLLKYFSLLDKEGQRLAGEVAEVKSFEIPADGIFMGDMMKYKITYDFVFPLAGSIDFLTIIQNFGGENSFVPSVANLSVEQGGVEVDYVTQMANGQAHTIHFDWSTPPVPLTASLRQRREQERRQQEAAMGISSYGSIYSFLYLERFEVRHEILIPLLTLDAFCPIERADRNFLEIEEQEAAKEAVGKFFSQRNPVLLDGIKVTPTVSRVDFYGLDFKDFAMMAPARRLSAMNARVGVILSYSTKGSLGKLTVDWDMFNAQTTIVRSTVFADDKADKFVFSRYRRQFRWTNPDPKQLPAISSIPAPAPLPGISIPWVSILCILGSVITCVMLLIKKRGLLSLFLPVMLAVVSVFAWPAVRVEIDDPFVREPELTDQQANAVFETLHKNIYRAFDYRDESEIYDALSHSVGGDLLQQLYLIVNQGRLMSEQGGAVSRIQQVDIVDGSRQDVFFNDNKQPAFTYKAKWTVLGTVEHWGHIHERTHEYQALFEVQAQSDVWRITGFEVLDEKRLKYKTRLRKI